MGVFILQGSVFGQDFLDELKRRNNLVDVASNYVKLQQKGSRYWACCPFHNEKTPSFSINEEGLYYCFGCKEAGNVIKFVQKMENIDFMDAVKFLADRAKMEVPQLKSSSAPIKDQQLKTRVLQCLDFAYKHYMENLYNKQAAKAQEYVKKRKFTHRELEDFKIGYSLSWTEIVEYLSSKGFTEAEMLAAGIIGKKGNRVFDVLGERLVFPIFNSFNECIGFSARALEKTDFAKYKNTAETIVFQKGKVVFGINLLKAQKQQQLLNKIILVEGQMDVIAMHKAGFKCTVACMGTALTKDHVNKLKGYNPNIYICFDADGAGTKATLRAIEMFRTEDVNLKVVRLSGGKDPDEVLNNLGSHKLQQMIDDALPYMDFLILHYHNLYNLEIAEEKNKFVKQILAEIKKLDSPTLFEPYLEKVRDITKIPLDVLRRDISLKPTSTATWVEPEKPAKQSGTNPAATFILASLLYKKDYVDTFIDYNKLLSEYQDVLQIINQNIPISAIYDIDGATENLDLMEAVNFNFASIGSDQQKYFNECLWKIAEAKLKKQQMTINEKYRQCEDLNMRQEYAKQLGKLAVMLSKKSLEEFNVRR